MRSKPDSNDLVVSQSMRLVAAYVSNNPVPSSGLPALIASVHGAFATLGQDRPAEAPAATVEQPTAAQIRASVGQHVIVSFIDGRAYKTLKRHLTARGLTPALYRERYGLPADYPITAPSYSQRRSALAKSIGLGVPGGMAKLANSVAR